MPKKYFSLPFTKNYDSFLEVAEHISTSVECRETNSNTFFFNWMTIFEYIQTLLNRNSGSRNFQCIFHHWWKGFCDSIFSEQWLYLFVWILPYASMCMHWTFCVLLNKLIIKISIITLVTPSSGWIFFHSICSKLSILLLCTFNWSTPLQMDLVSWLAVVSLSWSSSGYHLINWCYATQLYRN